VVVLFESPTPDSHEDDEEEERPTYLDDQTNLEK
jgi:hypothetical protein